MRYSRFINPRKSWELNHWCEELGLTAADLRQMIKRYGNDSELLRRLVNGHPGR